MLALEGAVPAGWVGVGETDDRDLDQMTCNQRIKKKKGQERCRPIGEGESAEKGEFCTVVKRQGRMIRRARWG
jgi:DNA/RNA-binding domain of Phe-tRNA-synthetase-like protein